MQVSGVRAVGRADGAGQTSWTRTSSVPGASAEANPFVLSAEAFQAQGWAGAGQPEQASVSAGVAWAEVLLAPGSNEGMVHVSVAYHSALDGAGADDLPTVALEAEVRATWLRNVSGDTVSRGQRAARIAEALADVAAIAGQSTVSVSNGDERIIPGLPDAVLIRGPVHPLAPMVWLPAEYPPPPDDPYLAAQLQAPAA